MSGFSGSGSGQWPPRLSGGAADAAGRVLVVVVDAGEGNGTLGLFFVTFVVSREKPSICVSLLHLTMNKTNRTITVAHPLSVLGAFVFRAFSTKVAGGTGSPAKGVHWTYREAATAAQAARLSQAFGHGWSSNLRTSASRSRVAA